MTLRHRLLATLALLAALASTAVGQQLRATLSHFSTDDGLTSNAISKIMQDDYGYIWIATWNGMARFDGYNFYNYKTGNGSRIKNLHNRIMDIAIDQSQNIWMRMYDGRVFVMNRSTDKIINPFEGYSSNETYKTSIPVFVTTTGEALVQIDGVGLYIMQLTRRGLKSEQATSGGLTITSMAEGYGNDIWLGTDKGIHRLDRANLTVQKKAILPNEYITCLISNGYNIYAATREGSIYSFAYGQEPQQLRQPSGTAILSLFVDSQGLIWICDTRMGAARLDPKTGNEKFFSQTVLVPEYDGQGGGFNESNGVVWVHMNHGGYGYYNRETDEVEYFHNDPSNPWNLSNTVYSTLELPEGVTWMSTSRRGLEKLEIQKNTIRRLLPVADAQTSLENEIRAIYYDRQRKLLLMGNKHSTLFITHADSTVTTIHTDDNGNSLGRLYGINRDSKGNYWLCSKDYGLFKMSPRQGGGWSLKNYRHIDGNKWTLNSNNAYQTVEDRDGNIWVATYGGGVNLLTHNKEGKEVFLHPDNGMRKYPYNAFRKVRTIALAKDGTVWAGTSDGILIMSYKNRQLTIEPLEDPDDDNRVLMSYDIVCLATDKTGTMWVGTNGGGLSHTTGKDSKGHWEFDTYGANDGLPSEEIRSVTFDEAGNVWFGTEHIICSFNREKQILSTFSSLDGVDETMLSEGAAITMPNNTLLFGTLNGYYIVDRKKLMTSTGSLLKLRITDFFYNGEIQSPRFGGDYKEYPAESKRIEVPGHSGVFAFRFAALNYQLQHRVHYQSMLEGYDEDWQNADKERMARYADVPGGTYRFKVKAFLLESPDKYDMRTVEVIVPAHFLISSTAVWCYIGGGAIVITALLFAYQNRLRKRKGAKDKPTDDTDDKAHDDNDDDREIKTDDYEIIEPDNE